MKTKLLLLTYLATEFIFSASAVSAGELLDSSVETDGDHYLIHIEMRIDVPLKMVYHHFTDYANLNKLSESITESEVLYHNPPQYRVRVVTNGCVAFFCREIVQVEDVTELRNGYILVKVLPESSDMAYGKTLWHIRAEGDKTLVTFSSDLVPDFWVPPLIGPMIFKSQLLTETQAVIDGLEQVALSPHDHPI